MRARVWPSWPVELWRGARGFFLLGDGRDRNAAMEGLRGYAVLLVFFVHAAGDYFNNWRHLPCEQLTARPLIELRTRLPASDLALVFLQNSQYGVDLFFLLSGFLIARLVTSTRRRFSYTDFLRKRFLRLYPAFFLALLIATIVQIGYLKWFSFSGRDFLENALLLYGCPSVRVRPYNFVAWSLFYEAAFYLLAPALFGLLARARNGDGPWRPAAGVGLLAAVLVLNAWLPRFPGFFFGALIGLCPSDMVARTAKALPAWLVATAYAGVLVYFYGFTADRTYLLPLFWLTGSALFVKTCFDDGVLNKVFRFPPLRLLGNLSYSFYLLHVSALWLAGKWFGPLLRRWDGAAQLGAYFAVCFLLALAMGAVLFAVAERWYFWYAHRGRGQTAEAPGAALAPSPLAKAG